MENILFSPGFFHIDESYSIDEWAVFKILLSFHYTGWFIKIPLLDYYDTQYIGWFFIQLIHQPREVLNIAQMDWVLWIVYHKNMRFP